MQKIQLYIPTPDKQLQLSLRCCLWEERWLSYYDENVHENPIFPIQ